MLSWCSKVGKVDEVQASGRRLVTGAKVCSGGSSTGGVLAKRIGHAFIIVCLVDGGGGGAKERRQC